MKKILLLVLLAIATTTGCSCNSNRDSATVNNTTVDNTTRGESRKSSGVSIMGVDVADLGVDVTHGSVTSINSVITGDKVIINGVDVTDKFYGPQVMGSGVFVTKDIAADDFSYIQLSDNIDVSFTQKSGAPSVTIYAEDNIIDLLDVGVIGNNTLSIRFKTIRFNSSANRVNCKGVTVNVSGRTLNGVSVSGSGNVSVSGGLKTSSLYVTLVGSGGIDMRNVSSEQTSVSISGSGDVSLSGSTNSARYSIAGSGNIRAQSFVAKSVEANISGSGDIYCYASDNIKTSSAGSGRIRYSGNPRVN